MNISIERFRRIEAQLRTDIGADAADVVCAVIAICAECSSLVLDRADVEISCAKLADCLGANREITASRLMRANDAVAMSFGFLITADFEPGPALPPRLLLSRAFVALVRSIAQTPND